MPSIMTSRQSAELDHAFERNGWTSEDVKKLSGGDILATFLLVIRDRAEVVVRSILTLLRTVHIASQPAGITSEKYFEEVGVQRTSSNFKSQFYGLEVAATDEIELTVYKLEENSLDASILAELGDKTETSVSQFHAFLAANSKSSEWFIFYLRGKDGNLWVVDAYWSSDYGGWSVNANSIENLNRWNAGNHVVSRNSSVFSHSYGWEFLFSIPFFHPPNSRPISSSFSINSACCPVIISLFSQAISEKNLILSIFKIACSRNGSLSASEAYLP